MTISEWLAIMTRRWPVLLIGLLCTASAVLLVHKRPIAYQACGNVLVTQPITVGNPNVYDNPQQPLVTATSVIAEQLMSDSVQQMLQAKGLTAAYQAQVVNTGTGQAPSYPEPLTSVCASSYNAELSQRTADAVVTQFGDILRARQVAAHITPASFLTDTVLAMPASVPVTGRPSQAYLGAVGIGLISTVAVALWTDQLLRRRRKGYSST